MLLHLTACTELVEGALCHPREDVDHGVESVLLVAFRECYNLQSKCKEGTIKESVHEEHLACTRGNLFTAEDENLCL